MAVVKYKCSSGEVKQLKNIVVNSDFESWRPEPDWLDVDKILQEDTEDYTGKMICLLTNSNTKTVIPNWNASKIKTSDGKEYLPEAQGNIEHVWNIEFDKECSKGYKTRYVIYYFLDGTTNGSYMYRKLPKETLYCIIANMNITITSQNWANGIFQNSYLLRYIKHRNVWYKYFPPFSGCYGLVGIEDFRFEEFNASGYFRACICLRKLPRCFTENIDKINSFSELLRETKGIYDVDFEIKLSKNYLEEVFNSSNISNIKAVDYDNSISPPSWVSSLPCLMNINEVKNIKVNGLNFSSSALLNHDTLIRVLNALFDYSEDTEETHTITLGTTNLAKLSDEELAVGQNKGWTIC